METSNNLDIRKHLKDELFKRIEKNSAYSLRAFARDLEIDHGSLSQIISGKRSLSLKNFEKIKDNISLSSLQINLLKECLEQNLVNFTTYQDKDIIAMNKWYHCAILELLDTTNFKNDLKWIASRLDLDIVEIEDAFEILEELKMITKQSGIWKPVNNNTSTLDGTQMKNLSLASIVQDVQQQYFEKQLNAFKKFPMEKMSHYGLTFALDPDDLLSFRKKMLSLIKEMNLAAEAPNKKKKEVYRLNLSLFPVTIV